MTNTVASPDAEDLRAQANELRLQLRETRGEWQEYRDRLHAGEVAGVSEVKASLRQVSELIRLVLILENRIDEQRKADAGVARGGYALDLDAARTEIRCRLDRLRRCGDP
ncbi:hypothetical protein [Mesobacterium pallidum]|uniref:hypothetical protein n=1 Tax=Mesobacterium pallidum TaxID=2872037 RepID=UPI001EE38377|nr:hypothetical protein [Mesobacterium pallidum]